MQQFTPPPLIGCPLKKQQHHNNNKQNKTTTTTSLIPCRKIGSLYQGKAIAATQAMLPILTRACSIFMCPNNGMVASVGILTSTQMLMHATAHRGYMNTTGVFAPKIKSGGKSLAAPVNQIHISIASDFLVWCSTSSTTSYPNFKGPLTNWVNETTSM